MLYTDWLCLSLTTLEDITLPQNALTEIVNKIKYN